MIVVLVRGLQMGRGRSARRRRWCCCCCCLSSSSTSVVTKPPLLSQKNLYSLFTRKAKAKRLKGEEQTKRLHICKVQMGNTVMVMRRLGERTSGPSESPHGLRRTCGPCRSFIWIRPGWVSVANVREKQDWSKSECILTTSAKENFRQQLLGLEVLL